MTSLICNSNGIKKIANISEIFPNLENLVLINNNISNIDELSKLVMNKKLKRLYLLNNPISQIENYRLYIISKIPQLKILDFQKIKLKERKKAVEIFGTQNESDVKKFILNLSRKEKIKLVIEKASSLEEINKLELLLKAGDLNDDILEAKLMELQ